MMKILIIGHSGHGKDTLCEALGVPFSSASRYALNVFMYERLKQARGYKSPLECWKDRRFLQGAWKDEINQYIMYDPCRIMREVFQHFDVYNGVRTRREFEAGKKEGLFDLVVWVDACGRVPNDSYLEISRADCDMVIQNSGPISDLVKSAGVIKSLLKGNIRMVSKDRERMLKRTLRNARKDPWQEFAERNRGNWLDAVKREGDKLDIGELGVKMDGYAEKNGIVTSVGLGSAPDIKDLIVEWADEVFPDRTITNAIHKLVLEEIPEYLMAQHDPMELADIGILLYDIAHLAGVDLETAMREKMEINKRRAWGVDAVTGLLKHTRGK